MLLADAGDRLAEHVIEKLPRLGIDLHQFAPLHFKALLASPYHPRAAHPAESTGRLFVTSG
jgi:hypothetical protein